MNDVEIKSILKELDDVDRHAFDVDEALTDLLRRVEKLED